MRVLETKLNTGAGMGKRKHKIRKSKSQEYASDSSDEGAMAATRCSHLNKSINPNMMKKTLRRVGILGDCIACTDGSQRQGDASQKPDVSPPDDGLEGMFDLAEPTIWLCLQCGHQGCDRNSHDKHALKHYETPHSTSHAVAVNITSWMIWCYACDEEVPVQSSGKLQDTVEFVRKQNGLPGIRSELPVTPVLSGRKSDTTVSEAHVDSVASRDDRGKQNRPRPPQLGLSPGLTIAKVKGLSNLGNTCFFNAVIQNLSQTPLLENILADQGRKGALLMIPGCSVVSDGDTCSEAEEDKSVESDGEDADKSDKGPLQITLGEAGALTKSVTTFLRDMNSPSKNSTLSPTSLFGQVCRKAPRFKGYQQQDSHELLRHLLDGMKAEEIKRSQAGILKAFHLPENVNPRKVDEETKSKLKAYGRQVKHTFVDGIFGGSFISTVLCEDCSTPSQIFEPFLDISLPIMEEKVLRPVPLWSVKGKGVTQNVVADGGLPAFAGDLLSSPPAHQPSKHLSKKEQRKAKKEAKRKAQASLRKGGECLDNPKTATEYGNEERCSSAELLKEGVGEETKPRSDSLTQSEEDVSDADIEDNIESDIARNRFKTLDLTPDATSLKSLDSDTCCSGSRENISLDTIGNGKATTVVDGERPSENSPRTSTSLDLSKCSGVHHIIKSANGANIDRDTNGDRMSKDSGISVGELTCLLKSTKLDVEKAEEENGAHSGCSRSSTPANVPNSETHETAKVPRVEKSRRALYREAQMRAMKSLSPRYHPVSHECSIKSCLNQFTQPELLTGNNKFGCSACTMHKRGKMVGKDGKKELVYSNASKQILIFCPPAVLTLHLKRFQQVGFRLRKVNKHVDFPLVLDVAPFCSALCQGVKPGQSQVLYSLYGVVEHSGQLTAGHFTAYVKVRPDTHLARLQSFLTQMAPRASSADVLLQQLQALSKEKAVAEAGGGASGHDSSSGDESVSGDDTNLPAGKWYYISDSCVSEVVNESSVLHCQAYLLFYERIC